MRVKAIGVQRMRGVGKQSGMPYDFAQLLILRPIEQVSGEKFSLQGIGFELGKLDLQIEAMHLFNDVKFPCDLDVSVDTVPGRQGLKSVITGFTAQQGVRAAA